MARAHLHGDELIAARHLPADVERVWTASFDEPVTGLRTTVTIRAAGTGTDLTVHQRRLPSELRTDQAANGLASILDALATYLRR
ncbi:MULTISPECIES: SRPBCC domain-containing protein [Micromonospora]|uniref:SRPBCC domain-containing protein n=1 Tax=Micromonospora TaxID=1873 RepID=UPI000AC3C85C|nr:SRPBCC domain-containing protein [Micromonospora yangpuensis]GGM06100.1 hypothetical protein GCM10012279_24850 [Micromonospora yangpuensis]